MQTQAGRSRTGGSRTEVHRHLGAARVDEVFRVVEDAAEADGVRPINEHAMLHLRYGGDADVRHVLRYEGKTLVGYGHLDVTDPVEGSSGELVVHPAHRRAGHGREVVAALLQQSPDGRMRLWAHGEHAGARHLAEGMGFSRSRVLWQMRRSLYAPLPAGRDLDGVRVRTFRPGEDDEAWVALNSVAFAEHPEQGALTLEDLHRRMREPWFDASGFFLAHREGGELVGFHWTKVHGGAGQIDRGQIHDGHIDGGKSGSGEDTRRGGHGHDPIGEVYAVGVHPAARGTGLGSELTLVGLRHLRSRGLPQAMLYVEATNTPAIRLYESLGFTHWDTDVMYRIGSERPEPAA